MHELRYDVGAATAGLYFERELPAERTLSPSDRNHFGDIEGSVYYPALASGAISGPVFTTNTEFANTSQALPIVFIAQGRLAGEPNGFLGYSYLQFALAHAGVIAVSVRLDLVAQGLAGVIQNETEWAHRLMASMYHFGQLSEDPTSPFHGRIDWTRIGLLGHSHGGLAVMRVPGLVQSAALSRQNNWQVKALMTVGTNFMSGLPPAGIPFMTILPAAEGGYTGYTPPFPTGAPGFPDVPGARLFDHAAVPFKAQLYVHHADHQSFNRNFPRDNRTDLMGRRQQELILSAYASAFFRAFLPAPAGTATSSGATVIYPPLSYVNGRVLPVLHQAASPSSGQYADVDVDVADLVLSWNSRDSLTVDDHENNDAGHNALGGAITTPGLAASEAAVSAAAGYAGETRALLVSQMSCDPSNPGACVGYVRSELPLQHRDLTGRRAVVVRVAEPINAIDSAQPTGVTFELTLDAGTETASVTADAVGGVARPYHRGDLSQRWVMKTLRFPLTCFDADFLARHRNAIHAIRLRPIAVAGRRVAFDDLQVE